MIPYRLLTFCSRTWIRFNLDYHISNSLFITSGILDILSGDMPKGIKIQTKHLEALIELHNMTQTFARNIQHLFSESDLRVLMDTLKSVYLPYESFKQR